jgi:hypothetical protein
MRRIGSPNRLLVREEKVAESLIWQFSSDQFCRQLGTFNQSTRKDLRLRLLR